VTVTIPKGSLFCVKEYQTNSTQVLTAQAGCPKINIALGDAVNNSNVDETATTSTDSGGNKMIPPLGVVAMSSLPAIVSLGSSRSCGAGDATVDATGDTGYARMFGANFAYMNGGVFGDSMGALSTSDTKRMAFATTYGQIIWMDPGLNDLNSAKSALFVETAIEKVVNQWPALAYVVINNEAAFTATSDSCATDANQTLETWEAQRVLLNTWVNSRSGYNQIVKPDAFDGHSTNFSLFNNASVPGGGVAFSTDCVHELSAPLVAMVAANLFVPSAVHYP
jgi:hypothetical protein